MKRQGRQSWSASALHRPLRHTGQRLRRQYKQQTLSEAAGILSRIQGLDPETAGLSEGQQRLAALEQQQIAHAIKEHWAGV